MAQEEYMSVNEINKIVGQLIMRVPGSIVARDIGACCECEAATSSGCYKYCDKCLREQGKIAQTNIKSAIDLYRRLEVMIRFALQRCQITNAGGRSFDMKDYYKLLEILDSIPKDESLIQGE